MWKCSRGPGELPGPSWRNSGPSRSQATHILVQTRKPAVPGAYSLSRRRPNPNRKRGLPDHPGGFSWYEHLDSSQGTTERMSSLFQGPTELLPRTSFNHFHPHPLPVHSAVWTFGLWASPMRSMPIRCCLFQEMFLLHYISSIRTLSHQP